MLALMELSLKESQRENVSTNQNVMTSQTFLRAKRLFHDHNS